MAETEPKRIHDLRNADRPRRGSAFVFVAAPRVAGGRTTMARIACSSCDAHAELPSPSIGVDSERDKILTTKFRRQGWITDGYRPRKNRCPSCAGTVRAASARREPLQPAVETFIESDHPEGWQGTATELLGALNARTPDEVRRGVAWPQQPQALGIRIAQIAPALGSRGFAVDRRHSGDRQISITPVASPESPKQEANPMAQTAVVPIRPNPNDLMSKDQRAATRRLLDEFFDDAKGIYLEGYSDQRIGTELGVPWAAIKTIRETAYGPIKADPAVDGAAAQVAAAAAELKELTRLCTKMRVDLEDMNRANVAMRAGNDRVLKDAAALAVTVERLTREYADLKARYRS